MTQPSAAPHPRVNRLLGALPPENLDAILPQITVVPCHIKQLVYAVNQPITQVYFPLSGVFSMLALTDENVGVEVGTVGSEGMVGLPVFLGATTAPTLAFSQVPGYAACLEVDAFRQAVDQYPALHTLMHRYTQALFNQIAQGAACNRHHETQQRLARWILQTHDRVGTDTFPLTHEFIAQMLGVRRATATEAAQALQARGLITYHRGMVTVADREGVEAVACVCYRVITDDFDKLIPRNPTIHTHRAEPWGVSEVADRNDETRSA